MVLNSGESKMELTLYEELGINMNREQMKRNLTLEFNGKCGNKRPKLASSVLLSSPDVNKFKMSSPEMEKLLMNSERTPTPSTFFFPKNVTAEQEMYVQGFEKALNELQNSDSSQGGLATEVSRASSTSNYVTLDLDSSYPASFGFGMSPGESTVIKDEPQTVPNVCSSPPVSPIDMESQERYKLERKRLRNRVAASKCRKKKLEKIAHLEAKVKVLKGENSELTLVVNRLREEVCHLKEQVISHGRSGCKISYPQHL